MLLNFIPFPTLTTTRLVLRKPSNADAAQLHKLRSNTTVNALVGRADSTGISDAELFISKVEGYIDTNQSLYWAITLKEDDVLIGTVCLWNFNNEKKTAEIGYELLPEYQGKGIMLEAVRKVIEYAFEDIKAEVITAYTSAENGSSVTLLKKIKFEINSDYHSGPIDEHNLLIYALERSNFY